MSKYAPVIKKDSEGRETFVSQRNYRPIDLDTGNINNRFVTLWEDEETGIITTDAEKLEKFLEGLES